MTASEPTTREQVARGADRTVTTLLICGQAFVSFSIASLSLLLMMASDGCFDEPDDAFICSDAGERVFYGGLLAEWLLLAGGIVVSIVLSKRAVDRGRRSWPTPFIGAGVGLLGVLVMMATVAIVGS